MILPHVQKIYFNSTKIPFAFWTHLFRFECLLHYILIKLLFPQVFTQKIKNNLSMIEQPTTKIQIIKQREERHRKLMKMIKHYKRTNQQVGKLERIKNNTVMEINLRFLRSQHNKYYIFPKNKEDSDEEQTQVGSPFEMKESQYYNLQSQNQVRKIELSQNAELKNMSKRVKSLDRERDADEQVRLGRYEFKKVMASYKNLKKKSVAEVKRVFSSVKLPELNKRQKLKTQQKHEEAEVEKIIGKKLLTQQNSPRKLEKSTNYMPVYKSKKRLESIKTIK